MESFWSKTNKPNPSLGFLSALAPPPSSPPEKSRPLFVDAVWCEEEKKRKRRKYAKRRNSRQLSNSRSNVIDKKLCLGISPGTEAPLSIISEAWGFLPSYLTPVW
ncbi:uncharacterized protein GLRG_04510 [Colletotrichum graminicola M1.001]|uniref:Uncharacterized protein n=1 Tax=Colletotrichum graminicola (strain M1.001 / M2 / FGSC 10212) TaxID=645133 RepID=E3QER0_COLGM|nr:uncharacterized protein GLRG_04510 [Colletotrichum graminicola M1.001]EFQ29366.1 hypothetical protein GLRG_04510 [Colletotrichum graminicola M1.001]